MAQPFNTYIKYAIVSKKTFNQASFTLVIGAEEKNLYLLKYID